jgi:hypothetical protein
MTPRQEPKRSAAERQEDQVREALRRFYASVDEALAAANAAEQAKRTLERLTGGLREELCK